MSKAPLGKYQYSPDESFSHAANLTLYCAPTVQMRAAYQSFTDCVNYRGPRHAYPLHSARFAGSKGRNLCLLRLDEVLPASMLLTTNLPRVRPRRDTRRHTAIFPPHYGRKLETRRVVMRGFTGDLNCSGDRSRPEI